MGVRLKKERDVEEFAVKAKTSDDYIGYIAWALIYMHVKYEKRDLGI